MQGSPITRVLVRFLSKRSSAIRAEVWAIGPAAKISRSCSGRRGSLSIELIDSRQRSLRQHNASLTGRQTVSMLDPEAKSVRLRPRLLQVPFDSSLDFGSGWFNRAFLEQRFDLSCMFTTRPGGRLQFHFAIGEVIVGSPPEVVKSGNQNTCNPSLLMSTCQKRLVEVVVSAAWHLDPR
jgi:hypothetical protein